MLLNLTPSTQLKSQTQWQQNKKVVPMLSNMTPFPTSNKALPCHLKNYFVSFSKTLFRYYIFLKY